MNSAFIEQGQNLNYTRLNNQMCQQFQSYLVKHYDRVLQLENDFKNIFEDMVSIEEVNVFFDFEMSRNMDDVDFYINFEEFNAREDPSKIEQLVNECLEIVRTNIDNLNINFKTVQQVGNLPYNKEGL